jgi:hypothetical protein
MQKSIHIDYQDNLSVEKKLLLQAALGDEALCLTAWHDWKIRVDIDNIDSDSYLLLPLLYRNLLIHQINDIEITQLKGIYRKNWYKNQFFLDQLTQIWSTFSEAGIACIVLGDLAINLSVYSNLGDRVINNLELMIPVEDFDNTIRVLNELGWHSRVEIIKKSFFEFYSSIYLWNEVGDCLHLHWRLWEGILYNNLISKTTVLNNNDLNFTILDFPYQIIHICSKIKRLDFNFTLYWLADIIMIIKQFQQNQNANFELIISNLQKYHVAIPFNNFIHIQRVLGILNESFSKQIDSISITEKEQREFNWIIQKRKRFLGHFIQYYLGYLQWKMINFRSDHWLEVLIYIKKYLLFKIVYQPPR